MVNYPDFRQPSNRGFTLVELLVAMALSLFVMALFGSLFLNATQSVQKAKGIATADQNVRTSVLTIKKDLADLYLRSEFDGATNPSKIFIADNAATRPSGGYFMIEENSPAIRQGVDQFGLPLDVDTDDVIAWTARRAGDSVPEMFFGKVPAGSALDNFNALRRFDATNNGLSTSTLAEVAYFLRADSAQSTTPQIRGRDALDPTVINVSAPVTYTLYRRQLLIIDDAELLANMNAANISPSNYYRDYAVAAKPLGTRMDFASIDNIDERWRRFGLWHDPAQADIMLKNDFPLSFAGISTANPIFEQWALLDGDNNGVVDGNAAWFGRPISREMNVAGDFFGKVNPPTDTRRPDPSNTTQEQTAPDGLMDVDVDDSSDITGADYAAAATAYGEDVLLRNVISFNVRVFDNDSRDEANVSTRVPNNATNLTTTPTTSDFVNYSLRVATRTLATTAINPYYDKTWNNASGTMQYRDASAPANDLSAEERLPDFVDLGYRGFMGRQTPQLMIQPGGTGVNDLVGALSGDQNWQQTNPSSLTNYERKLDATYSHYYRNNAGVIEVSPSGTVNGSTQTYLLTIMSDGDVRNFEHAYSYHFYDFENPGNRKPNANHGWPRRWRLGGTRATGTAITNTTYRPYATYDTWSDAYPVDPQTNPTNYRAIPYAKPLRGIEISIRVLEPLTGTMRDYQIVHAFVDD